MSDIASIFENLPRMLSAEQVAVVIGGSRKTVYDMNYRPRKYDVPEGMFLRNGRRLLVRTDVLKDWFISRQRS